YIRAMTTKEDIKAQISWGIEQGLEQGLEKGIAQGIEQGAGQERLKIVKNMKVRGFSDEEIADCVGITSDDVRKLLD
ncbi:MAG: hypothetical protein ACI3ZQ_02745, partial [Candidatus Cryptobacteroides sp.]